MIDWELIALMAAIWFGLVVLLLSVWGIFRK